MDQVAFDCGTRVLLASNRPAIRAFFPSPQEAPGNSFDLRQVPIPSDPGPALFNEIQLADLAVLDVPPDPVAAVELCRALKTHKPSLPIAALLCCTEHVAPWQLSALIDAGVTSLLDLHASAEDLALAFRSIARGGMVLHLHAAIGSGSLLRHITTRNRGDRTTDLSPTEADIPLLRMVARGLSDHEIGTRLHISPFTVRHHIERLRRELVARNRIELAAWAGRNGFYGPSEVETDFETGMDRAAGEN
jgi:DNA-binding NarL/FixJ family response regulator